MTADSATELPTAPEQLRHVLRTHYGVTATGLAPLTGGLDRAAQTFRIEPESGPDLVLRVSLGRPRREVYAVPYEVRLSGVDDVVAPLPAGTGALFVHAAGVTWSLYPFIDGVDGWTRALSGGDWRRLGETLRAVHGVDPGPFTGMRCPDRDVTPYDVLPRWDRRLREDPELADFWRQYRPATAAMLEQMRALQQRSRPGTAVLCHGDLHPGNILLAGNRPHLIDWDDVLLSAKERDFIFVPHDDRPTDTGPLPLDAEFLNGYGIAAGDVDWAALTYFRCERVVQDVLVEWESAASGGARARAAAVDLLRGAFSPGGEADAARAAARHLPADLDLLSPAVGYAEPPAG
ncbi:MAG TPA: phosphotransferase [Mycobacteriales bacterium]|jgi:spectinomycin phosphotransferase|nr:phosphotransferase [Mycobacteriales bacterium]